MKKCFYCHEGIDEGTEICPACGMPQEKLVTATIKNSDTAQFIFSGGEIFEAPLPSASLSIVTS